MIEITLDVKRAIEDIYWANYLSYTDDYDEHYKAISEQFVAQMMGWA